MEQLEEGWVKFRRVPCLEGHIDFWNGDQADDPNSPTQSRIHLNSSSTWFRFSGDVEWLSSRDSSKRIYANDLVNGAKHFTSDQLKEMFYGQ